jgi:GxxExxY protein
MDGNGNLTGRILACAIDVHKHLGPGLLESAYQQCLAHELRLAGLRFMLEQAMPVKYKGLNLDCGYRLDLVVEQEVIVELKSVSKVLPIHEAQLLTYMKLAKMKTGLLINFNERLLKNGVKRFIL